MIKNWNLYLVTEEKLSSGRTTLEIAEKAVMGGVEVIQLRDKNMNLPKRYQIGQKLRNLTEKEGVDFIVNDRVDLALALEADGVHLGQSDLPLKAARSLLGPDKIIGISVSNSREAVAAERKGADYLGVGAVFATQSKDVKKEKSSLGIEGVQAIRESCTLPLVAIGGLDIDNVSEVIEAGADAAAVISALTQAQKVEEKARIFNNKIKKVKIRRD